MKPAEWIRKHKVIWGRWPDIRELKQQFQQLSEPYLNQILQRVKQAK